MSELLKQPRDQPVQPPIAHPWCTLGSSAPVPIQYDNLEPWEPALLPVSSPGADVKRYSKLATVDAELTALYIGPRRKYR